MEKKNNFMLVMIVILSVSLLGAVSFIVYDKVIKKDAVSSTTNTSNNSGLSENNQVQVIKQTKGERYAEFLKNLKEQRSKENIYSDINATGLLFCESTYKFAEITNDGKLILGSDQSRDEVDSNVLIAYIGYSGNGGCSYLYYIKEDGTLKNVSGIDKANGRFIIKDTNYKNIVNMSTSVYGWETSGVASTTFVDIDGNIVKYSD